ncbi:PLDc N-terminal domain-containing protein [Parabacteroides faecis]
MSNSLKTIFILVVLLIPVIGISIYYFSKR